MAEIECLGDEDDFMSDKWLKPENDVKPGVSILRSSKRDFKIFHGKINAKEKIRQKNAAKRLKKNEKIIIEKTRTEIALQTKLPESNKGFKMMAKMGYKTGMSLGSSTAENPLIEPLKPKLADAYKNPKERLGIGVVSERKRVVQAQQARIKVQKVEVEKLEERYKTEQRRKYDNRRSVEADLEKAQRICEELDDRECIMSPKESYFYPKPPPPPTPEDEEPPEPQPDPYENVPPTEKLANILDYLKNQHFYCMFCAITYNDLSDFEKNCPGPNREDHD